MIHKHIVIVFTECNCYPSEFICESRFEEFSNSIVHKHNKHCILTQIDLIQYYIQIIDHASDDENEHMI